MEPLNPPANQVAVPTVSSGPETLSKPRILCLHGAGVNAPVFHMQMRCLIPVLAPHFRLVFVDGPYDSEMHPALALVYDDFGPYCRWGPWRAAHGRRDFGLCVAEIEQRLRATMRADKGSGPWVGVLGFSQGAKLAASILIENQMRRGRGGGDVDRDGEVGYAGAWWKFGIILAGRARPYALSRDLEGDPFFDVTGETLAGTVGFGETRGFEHRLRTPTLHVHGLQDPGLEEHRQLLEDYCTSESSVLVEWDDGHRIVYRSPDVKAVYDGIVKVAKMAGVL